MKFLNKFLKVKTKNRSFFQIIFWWEIRRVLYNIVVLISGILSISIMLLAASVFISFQPGVDFIEPAMILIFAFLCNLFYTLGWLIELFIKPSLTFGPRMFKLGVYFTLFWVFLPAAIYVFIAIVEIIKKLF